jgi:hypothetical protein
LNGGQLEFGSTFGHIQELENNCSLRQWQTTFVVDLLLDAMTTMMISAMTTMVMILAMMLMMWCVVVEAVDDQINNSTTDATVVAKDDCCHILMVTATKQSNNGNNDGWIFAAQMSSLYEIETGWDKYCDGFSISSFTSSSSGVEEEQILTTRVLAHPHPNEQPFTRSTSTVIIPPEISVVVAAARDSVLGYCGDTVTIDLTLSTTMDGAGGSVVVATRAPTQSPQPIDNEDNGGTFMPSSSSSSLTGNETDPDDDDNNEEMTITPVPTTPSISPIPTMQLPNPENAPPPSLATKRFINTLMSSSWIALLAVSLVTVTISRLIEAH